MPIDTRQFRWFVTGAVVEAFDEANLPCTGVDFKQACRRTTWIAMEFTMGRLELDDELHSDFEVYVATEAKRRFKPR